MSEPGTFNWRYLFRLALGVVFIWAALAKIADPGAFAKEIGYFRMVPLSLQNVFALALPWVELVAGVALVLNLVPRAATLLLGGLLVVFMIAIGVALARGLDIDCGCFGTRDAASTGWVTLARDVGFLALAFLGYPRGTRETAPSGQVQTA